MRLKTVIIIVLLGLMFIAVTSFAQADPPSGTPGNILNTIAGLQTQITELFGNATEQEQAIHDETAARLNGDQALLENATEQQNAIDAIVSICPGQCPGGQYVIGVDQDGSIICACPLTALPDYCPDIGCVNLSTDPLNCGECGNSCLPGFQCIDGECIDMCVPPLTNCDGICVNLDSDQHNCGSCGHECGSGELVYCCDGACTSECREQG